jgi:hypothetical protein
MTNPPDLDDEGLQMAQRDEPEEEPHHDDAPPTEPEQPQQDPTISDHARFSTIGLFTFLGGFAFVLFAVLVGYIYLIQPGPSHRLPSLSDDAPSTPRPSATPIRHLPTPPPIPKGLTLKTDLPITADALHVTSIALGDIHLAIVNGKRLAEGDWLLVRMGSDVAAVQVAKMEDGVVHFTYGARTIDSKLLKPSKQKAPH